MESKKIIALSGREFNSKILLQELEWARTLQWIKTTWKSKDALVDKKSGSIWLYLNQQYDKNQIELIPDGWTHDHCDICYSDIRDSDSCAASGHHIICADCYSDFITNEKYT